MSIFKKKIKPHKTTYFFCGLPIWRTTPSVKSIAHENLKRINKLDYCLLPDITTLPPARGIRRELQLANLKILIEVDKFCKKHNIRYWLSYGTLLGAVRHKDYIPWDDDIDISMLRSDYDKIIELFNKENPDSQIQLTYFSGPNGSSNMVKMRHKEIPELFIDIFPYELYTQKVPTWEEKIKLTQEIRKKTIKNRIPYKKQNLEVFHQRLRKIHFEKILENKPAAKEEDMPALFTSCDFMHDPKYCFFVDYETIFPLKTIEFCGHTFSCPQNEDILLTSLYGDYMGYPTYVDNIHTDIKKLPINSIMKIKEYIKK